MSQEQKPSNVIQFPGSKRDSAGEHPPALPKSQPQPQVKPSIKKMNRKTATTLAGAALAVMMATGAVNRYAFDSSEIRSTSQASLSSSSRTIASVERSTWKRDSQWEKQLAESLASTQTRSLASTQIGHAASLEEKLRWGTLEEKYTIYKPDANKIKSILLQDKSVSPSYVLDRRQFLKQYGSLLTDAYDSVQLKSVEVSSEKTIESYTIFDKDKRPINEAHFELDRHKRLLALHVEPAQI